MIENGLVMQSSQTEIESRSFRFLHLQDDTIEMARHTVHLIASALGAKRSALVIDGCFADIFQSCIKSVTQKDDDFIPIDRTSMSLDWSGSCIFANEVSKNSKISLPCRVANKFKRSFLLLDFGWCISSRQV